MKIEDATIQRTLLEKKLLTKEQIESAVLLAPSLGKSFVDTLIFKNYITEDALGQSLAEKIGAQYVSIGNRVIPHEVLTLVPEDAAVSHQVIAFNKTNNELSVAMADPTDFEIINLLEKKTGLIVRPYLTFPSQINAALAQYKSDINADLQKIMSTAPTPTDVTSDNLTKAAEEVPTIKMLDTIMQYAFAQNASDVHIEGQETNTIIRFRVDGILHDILVLDPRFQVALVARIKYLSNLKIDEHRLPQDGRFKYEHLETKVAVRVSIIPTFYSENVALRLLPETSKTPTLQELGFSPQNVEVLSKAITQTNGIILLTGPTGSGKTTTLYSILEILNRPEVKIATIEDPVEYSIPRISQTQVNPTTGMDFASGLRALLRHDPNVIMVGEIRDHETADISINAALTGHLVLSTLHTNDATSSISRLIDLDIEPFLLSATLRTVVAQRLVRRLCHVCAQPANMSEEELTSVAQMTRFSIDDLKNANFLVPVGCNECADGYKGRLAIHEVFIISPEINKLILSRAGNDDIRDLAMSNGMYTMMQDGIAKAGAGLTSVAEILRETGRQD